MSDTDPQVMASLSRIEQTLCAVTDKVERMDVLLRGSDDGERAGLVTRVDRIEQKEVRRDQISIAIIIAVLGSFAASAWALITGGKVH